MKYVPALVIAVLWAVLPARASDPKIPSSGEQFVFCFTFRDDNFSGLLEKVREYGYELYDIYDHVVCDASTKADLIKHRASLPSAKGDIISLARYFILEHNDPERVTEIFNRVITNPGRPTGTLLDWVDFYSANPNLYPHDIERFAEYEFVIRHFGGVRESELPQD